MASIKLPERVEGKRVAIIGGGPTGIAAAYFCGRAGIETTIFERERKLGGVPRYVIPAFRISDEAIDKDIALMLRYGVEDVYKRQLRWFAGLPAAFCGRTLEAVKPDRGDPPAIHVQVWRGLHGQRGVTFLLLHRFAQKSKGDFSVLSRLFSRILTKFPLKLFPPSCKINLQSMTDSCNEVLRARAETITPAETLTFRASDSLGASFLFA